MRCALRSQQILGGKAFIRFFVEFARAIIKTKSFVNEEKKV